MPVQFQADPTEDFRFFPHSGYLINVQLACLDIWVCWIDGLNFAVTEDNNVNEIIDNNSYINPDLLIPNMNTKFSVKSNFFVLISGTNGVPFIYILRFFFVFL